MTFIPRRSHSHRQQAERVARYARKMGCEADVQVAATGSAYVTIDHEALSEALTVRLSDHEPNVAAYRARVRNAADIECEDWLFAVQCLARRLGCVLPSAARAAATRRTNAVAARQARAAALDAERRAASADLRTKSIAFAAAHPELADTFRAADAVGKAAKHRKQRARRRLRALSGMDDMNWAAMVPEN